MRRRAPAVLVLAALLASPRSAQAQAGDPLAPKTDPRDAPIGRLTTITVGTRDLVASRRFYGAAMGMRERGPLPVDAKTKSALRKLWAIPAEIDWVTYLYDRPGAERAAQIRLMVLSKETKQIRPEWTGQRAGSLSIGFAIADMTRTVAHVAESGFGTTSGVSPLQLTRPDNGAAYTVEETHFKAPENIYGLGVARSAAMPPIGPIDPATGIGGPSYSGQTLIDSDSVLRFYVDALGMEVRRDMKMKSGGPTGGLALPAGTEFRFVQVYSPGENAGYLVFLDMTTNSLPNEVASRPPNRGITMWSFPVKDIKIAEARLKRNGATVVAGPMDLDTTEHGRHAALTVLAPNGFLVELFQPR